MQRLFFYLFIRNTLYEPVALTFRVSPAVFPSKCLEHVQYQDQNVLTIFVNVAGAMLLHASAKGTSFCMSNLF